MNDGKSTMESLFIDNSNNVNSIYIGSKIWWFIVVILFSSHCVTAQKNTFYFETLTSEDGLLSSRVNAIHEDKEGFIWLGTQDGLHKYAGYEFKIYQHIQGDSTSLIYNKIMAIAEDEFTGNLWIGTENGLSFFDRSTEEFINYFQNAHDTINTLVFDQNHVLWIGSNKGLYRLNPDKSFSKYHHDINNPNSIRDNQVAAIEIKDATHLWIGTHKGLDLYDIEKNIFAHHTMTPDLTDVLCIKQSSKDDLWVGSYVTGMYLMKQGEFNQKMNHYSKENGYLLNDRVQGIVEDEQGNIFIADRDGGLVYYEVANDIVSFYQPDLYNPNSLNSKALRSLMLSSTGMLWIGTYNSGVNYIDFNRKRFEHYKFNYKDDGLFNNNVRSMYQDSDGIIWIGTKEGGGLSKFNRENGSFKNYYSNDKEAYALRDDYIFDINEIDNRYLLLATYKKGLAVFDKTTERFEHFMYDENNPKSINSNTIYSLYKDKKGVVWVGCYSIAGSSGALCIFDYDKKEFTSIEGIEQARCFCEENENEIWIGTLDGLYLYNRSTGERQYYANDVSDSTTISNNNIIALQKDRDGYLWIGTDGGGLNRMDCTTHKCTVFNTENKFPSNRIFGLQLDGNGDLWLSSGIGLIEFNTTSHKTNIYDVSDGLQGNEFASYVSLKTKEGEMLFGGRNGFNLFKPELIKKNSVIPKVVITDLKLYNKSVEVGAKNSPLNKVISKTDMFELKHNQDVITFEYTALNFTSSEKNNYAYYLENFDEDWIFVGHKREASYTNLPAGEYVFRVKASNNDNIWNEVGTSVIVVVNPVWYETWWFRTFVVMFIIGAVLLYSRWRTRSLKESQDILKEKVEQATIEVESRNEKLEEAKEKIANIMTNVKTELSLTSVELLDATNSQASTIEEISSSIDQMAREINDNAINADKMFKDANTVDKNAELSVQLVKDTVKSIEDITKGIGFISEFSRTTNLLSLNAAIEAANAGVHGKSFGVVANEVKKLADQSQDVAVSIKRISESGLELSHDSNDKIVELQSYISNIVGLISQIRESSQGQSYEAANVNQAIQQISSYINSTAQLAEKLDKAINDLSIES